MNGRREVAEFLRDAKRDGLTITRRRSGIFVISDSAGLQVFVHNTPSDNRWKKNAEALLKRRTR